MLRSSISDDRIEIIDIHQCYGIVNVLQTNKRNVVPSKRSQEEGPQNIAESTN